LLLLLSLSIARRKCVPSYRQLMYINTPHVLPLLFVTAPVMHLGASAAQTCHIAELMADTALAAAAAALAVPHGNHYDAVWHNTGGYGGWGGWGKK
jgi:hypothetical protein